MESTLEAGQLLAERYRLVRRIGRGGSSVVWIADHVITDKRVALKVLTKRGDDVAARFLREARITSRVEHPNIVDIHDVFQLDESDELVMVMDLLEGFSLAEHLRSSGAVLSLSETRRIVLAVVSALEAAHALGIVHRDLKPDNLFVTKDGTVRVLDFGVAKWSRPTELATLTPDLTETGTIVGTPHYMAPEQIFGEPDVDGRADVWALGVIAYECLSGSRPIDGDNFGQVFKAIAVGELAPLGSRASGLAPEISGLVDRMLARKRDARPTLAEVRAAFEGATSGGAIVRSSAACYIRVVAALVLAAALGLTALQMPGQHRAPIAPVVTNEGATAAPVASAPVPPASDSDRDAGGVTPARASTSAAPSGRRRPTSPPAAPSSMPLPGRVHGEAPY